MSRLDSVIRRLCAQRSCLDAAAERISGLPGPVLEIGLGNGRTYDHLRERLPSRTIFVFDRVIAAHPDCVPPPELMFLGDLDDTLRRARERIAATAALAHVDIGSGRADQDRAVAEVLSRLLPPLMRPNGLIVSDQPLQDEAFAPEPLLHKVAPGRYFLYRCRG